MSWIGVDLDGTLAQYGGWKGPDTIGEPVPLMKERVMKWLNEGAIDEHSWRYMPGQLERRRRLRRMIDKFRAELLRRMAHYDAIRGLWVEER